MSRTMMVNGHESLIFGWLHYDISVTVRKVLMMFMYLSGNLFGWKKINS